MKYGRFLVLLIPVTILISFELVVFSPRLFYLILFLSNLFVLGAIILFLRRGSIEKSWESYVGSVILPLFFLSSGFVYSSLIVNKFIVQLLFFIIAIFIYLYLRNIYYYLIYPNLYKSYTLQNISSAGNFFILFFSAASIYGLQSFLNLPVWLLMVSMLGVIFFVIYQMIWINKIDLKIAFIYILISALVLLEIGWAISFLPLNHNIVGLSLAICYYVLMGLVVSYLTNVLDRKTIKLYIIFGFLGTLLIFLSARWM